MNPHMGDLPGGGLIIHELQPSSVLSDFYVEIVYFQFL